MGQSPSSVRSKSGRQRSFRSFVRRNKLNKSSLSHTFNLPPSEEYPELMNVNTATEEQLMTLPGVNRQLAQEIVRYRQMIGRFKRVDDLALVSGKTLAFHSFKNSSHSQSIILLLTNYFITICLMVIGIQLC